MDRVDPISEATMGKANVELMNEVGYDVVTIGNNEGITLAHDDLYHLYDEADYPVVCANLQPKSGQPPKWLVDTNIFETDSGVRLGFIGLTAPFTAFYDPLGWTVTSPYDELETNLLELSSKTDIIILLSHLGLSEDQEIARRFSEIDVIIGGHTHHLLRTGEYVNNCLITAAGKHCVYVGEVILTYDHESEQISTKEAYATNVSDHPVDQGTAVLLEELQEKADLLLEKEVVVLEEPLDVEWYKDPRLCKN